MGQENFELSGFDIAKGLEVAGNNKEALLFLQNEVEIKVVRAPKGVDYSPYMTIIQDKIDHVVTVDAIPETDWEGSSEGRDAKREQLDNYNFYLAKKVFDELGRDVSKEALQGITMIYDIGPSGFVRGYLRAGKPGEPQIPLDPNNSEDQKIMAVMDEGFHAWLVGHNMISKGGHIFEVEEGEPTREVNPEHFSELLVGKEDGYGESVSKIDKSLAISVRKAAPAPASVSQSTGPSGSDR